MNSFCMGEPKGDLIQMTRKGKLRTADTNESSDAKKNISTPYLDKLSLNCHVPEGDDPWKKLLIQPIAIPSLTHTGVRTALAPKQSHGDLLRPDGKSTKGLKHLIKKSVRTFQKDQSKTEISQRSISSLCQKSTFYDNPIAAGFQDGTAESLTLQENGEEFMSIRQMTKRKKKKRMTKQQRAVERLTLKRIPRKDTHNGFKMFEQMLDEQYAPGRVK